VPEISLLTHLVCKKIDIAPERQNACLARLSTSCFVEKLRMTEDKWRDQVEMLQLACSYFSWQG
jgi:hypothetical protein